MAVTVRTWAGYWKSGKFEVIEDVDFVFVATSDPRLPWLPSHAPKIQGQGWSAGVDPDRAARDRGPALAREQLVDVRDAVRDRVPQRSEL